MKLLKNKKKIVNLLLVIIFLVICLQLFLSEYRMHDYKITCGRCISFDKSKSNWYYDLEYQVGNTTYKSTRQGRNYSDKIRNYIDTVQCIKIAYSESDKTCIRIIDNKIANEWLWFLEDKDRE